VAAYTGPDGRQLSVVEADWGVESLAGHFSMSPQEVVAVDLAVTLDPVARVATQNCPFFVHFSINVHLSLYFSHSFTYRFI